MAMTMEPDYTEADRWDWDYSAPDQHCPHGTFIGSWWGPDLLCHWCEEGISVEEMHEHQRQAALWHALEKQARYEALVVTLTEKIGVRADVATWLVEFAWYQADGSLADQLP